MYFLGIDGGGTKTDFLLLDENGKTIAQRKIGTISYKHVGMDYVTELLRENINQILDGNDAYICLAFPNWGESRVNDERFLCRIDKITDRPMKIVNDSAAGWAGSLGLEEGINLVAGTGSIAYGQNKFGTEARAGGWDDGFSDEGSCYWLGKKALELFSKESDGRVKKGKLLEIFRYNFNLKNDFDLIDIFDEVYKNNRTKTAELQKLLLQAAMQGDEEAIRLYEAAAEELALIIGAVYRKLEFSGDTIVSYSGGLFHAGDFILKPLVRKLEENGICLCPPKYSPGQGAALLAAREYSRDGEFLSRIKAGLE